MDTINTLGYTASSHVGTISKKKLKLANKPL